MPRVFGCSRRQVLDDCAIERDRAGVGLEHAGDEIDPGALAGAVLADEAVDLSGAGPRSRRRRSTTLPANALVSPAVCEHRPALVLDRTWLGARLFAVLASRSSSSRLVATRVLPMVTSSRSGRPRVAPTGVEGLPIDPSPESRTQRRYAASGSRPASPAALLGGEGVGDDLIDLLRAGNLRDRVPVVRQLVARPLADVLVGDHRQRDVPRRRASPARPWPGSRGRAR